MRFARRGMQESDATGATKTVKTARHSRAPALVTLHTAPKHSTVQERKNPINVPLANIDMLTEHQQKLNSPIVIEYSPIETKCSGPRRT